MFEQIKGRLFSPDSAGAFLELSRAQIHRLISSQELTALKLGARTTRITGDSIAAPWAQGRGGAQAGMREKR